jgi:hypothetical protein
MSEVLPPGYTKAFTEDGTPCFINTADGSISWSLPQASTTSTTPPAPPSYPGAPTQNVPSHQGLPPPPPSYETMVSGSFSTSSTNLVQNTQQGRSDASKNTQCVRVWYCVIMSFLMFFALIALAIVFVTGP